MNGDASVEMMKADVRIMSSNKCGQTSEYSAVNITITDNMLCAGVSEGGKYFCGVMMEHSGRVFEHILFIDSRILG